MKVGLICCGRLENRYAVEFVEYYKQLGFNGIHIIDNNYGDEEYFEDVLQSYINENFVVIHNYRNKIAPQNFGYTEVYNKIHNNYDWIYVCDFDEFLTLKKDKTIQDYLSRECFKDYNQILIHWKIYSDNNLVYDDGKPCLERFTKVSKVNNWQIELVKPILRTTIKNPYIKNTMHHFYDENSILEKTSCNNIGEHVELVECGIVRFNDDLAYIKHFTTKTIDEFLNKKCKRGFGDCTYEDFIKNMGIKQNKHIDRFFEYNDITKEKLEYLVKNNYY